MRPQPETNGEVPLTDHPSLVWRASRRGWPDSAPPSASPARRSPRHSGPIQPRIASFSLAPAARTAPRCWTQTNAVVRHPDASASTTAHTVGKSASGSACVSDE